MNGAAISDEDASVQQLMSSSIKILKAWYKQLSREPHSVLQAAADQIVELIELKSVQYETELELHDISVDDALIGRTAFVPFHFMKTVSEKFAHYSLVKAEHGLLQRRQERMRTRQKQRKAPTVKRKRGYESETHSDGEDNDNDSERVRAGAVRWKKARVVAPAEEPPSEDMPTSDLDLENEIFGDFETPRTERALKDQQRLLPQGLRMVTPARSPLARKSRKSLRLKRSQAASSVTEHDWAEVAEQMNGVVLETPARSQRRAVLGLGRRSTIPQRKMTGGSTDGNTEDDGT
ncbi:hypothetical protein RI367_001201 [Sorochytrium milnesiophthora]